MAETKDHICQCLTYSENSSSCKYTPAHVGTKGVNQNLFLFFGQFLLICLKHSELPFWKGSVMNICQTWCAQCFHQHVSIYVCSSSLGLCSTLLNYLDE